VLLSRIGGCFLKISTCDSSRAKELLGWSPKVRFVDGLHRAMDWYLSTKDREQVEAVFNRMLTER